MLDSMSYRLGIESEEVDLETAVQNRDRIRAHTVLGLLSEFSKSEQTHIPSSMK